MKKKSLIDRGAKRGKIRVKTGQFLTQVYITIVTYKLYDITRDIVYTYSNCYYQCTEYHGSF